MSANPIPQSWEARKGVTPDWAPQFDIYVKGEASRTAIVVGPHAEARARLIEAAPELLRELEKFTKAVELFIGDAPEVRSARAAIAKAKGEA